MVERGRAALVIGLCVAGFAALAAAGDGLAGFDRGLLIGLRSATDLSDPLGPAWLEEAARDVTALGGTAFLSLVTAAIATIFLANGQWRLASFAAVSVIGATAASETLKALILRPRPDLVPHEVAVYSASFPSGHSMLAAAAFFTLAFALAREFDRRRNRVFLYVIAAVATFLVGASRVYLGVHWPTDVLAGWLAGIAWAVGAAFVYRRLTHAEARD